MKTIEQKEKEAKDYIAKASQHLFVVNDRIFTKVIMFKSNNGNEYFAKLEIEPNKTVRLNIYNIDSYYKWEMKQILFPQYVETKSIPYFKRMKEIVSIIEKEIKIDNNHELINKVNDLTKELELIK